MSGFGNGFYKGRSMNQRIVLRQNTQPQTLYGEMTDDQQKVIMGATVGIVAGVVLFVVVRKLKKRKRG